VTFAWKVRLRVETVSFTVCMFGFFVGAVWLPVYSSMAKSAA
jgi:hypothetical protein